MDYQLTCSAVRVALGSQQYAFARQTAERWLRAQPGHLTMSALLAEALLAGGERPEAQRILRQVLEVDPENESALALQVRLRELGGGSLWPGGLLWPVSDRATRRARSGDRPEPAGDRPEPVAEPAGDAIIPSLAELERRWRAGEVEAAREQAEQLLSTHPRLVKAHLILADCSMMRGAESSAVAHIHQAAGLDPGGEVARRIWDGKRPYVGAWPSTYVPGAAGPLPHPIASALGLNLLPEPAAPARPSTPSNGRNTPPHPHPPTPLPPISPAQEALINLQAEINRLSGRPEPRLDQVKWVRLKPIYAIITSKERLQLKYGREGWEQIDDALQALAQAAEARLKLPAGVLYLDDADSLSSFQLEPIDPADPWAVKKLLNQLDDRLEEEGQEIGWLLLVGGPDVIAFHRLPNPTDDGDPDVLSDNPYSCRDENYFVPQRAVGRLPDGAGDSPTLLLQGISAALTAHHATRRAQKGLLRRWWEWLAWLVRGRRPAPETSFGYAASVWRRASLAVFSKIGSTRRLRLSPPLTAAEFNGLALGPSRYGYFNLHGIADSAAWYGQRDPTFPADYPAFPVALRPEDVGVLGSPEVVFSEACYGALAEGRTAQTAICLKFLSSGSRMFVGSTCVAYGGLNSTPEAADLLASYFWQEIMAGRSGGVALQQAKVAFAQHLDDRQGYLDGEDQKTLISFVYYGDPTLTAPPGIFVARPRRSANQARKELAVCPPMVCAKGGDCNALDSVPAELVEQVRARVAGYLPGMESASLAVARQRTCPLRAWPCSDSRPEDSQLQCANCHLGAKGTTAGKVVFTLRKSARVAGELHEQVVKVTVDDDGQMLKLTVSK